MQIYWIEKQKRRGPVSVADVLSLIELGELSADTQAWHAGCKGWMPLKCLPALQEYFRDTSEKVPDEPRDATAPSNASPLPEAPPDSSPSPEKATTVPITAFLVGFFPRLVARLLDCVLYATMVLGILYSFHAPFSPYFLPGNPLFWLPFVVLESIFAYTVHTTPGKFWLGIALFPISGKVSYSQCLCRSLLAFSLGMGFMIPIILLVSLPLCVWSIRRSKLTFWDARSGIAPFSPHPSFSPLRIFSIGFTLFLCLQLCSLFLEPWIPDMLRDLATQNPDAANWLHDFFSSLETH